MFIFYGFTAIKAAPDFLFHTHPTMPPLKARYTKCS
jgi:hypothetical protein